MTKIQRDRAEAFRERRIAYLAERQERVQKLIASGEVRLPDPLPAETIAALRGGPRPF